MEQKGQRSLAFRLKERTGDGEVKGTHSQKGQKHLDALRLLDMRMKDCKSYSNDADLNLYLALCNNLT